MLSELLDSQDEPNFIIVHFTNGANKFDYEIVGERDYQDAIKAICEKYPKNQNELSVDAYLIPQGDKNAVAVLIQDKVVGFLPSKDCKTFRQKLRQMAPHNAIVQVQGRIVDGWYRCCENAGHFRVKLDLPCND